MQNITQRYIFITFFLLLFVYFLLFCYGFVNAYEEIREGAYCMVGFYFIYKEKESNK